MITALTLAQCVVYDRGGNRPSLAAVLSTSVATAVCIGYAFVVAATPRVKSHCLNVEEGGCVDDGYLNWLR